MTRAAWALALLLLLAPDVSAEPLRLRARVFDGTAWREAAEVVVDGGVITAVRDAGDDPLEGVLTPGLIDLDARYGLGGGDEEMPEILATDLRLRDAFAPDVSEADALRRSGVTSAWLLGGPSVVAAGAGAVVQPAAGSPRIARASWGLSASLASTARIAERAPTSLPDQADALATVLGEIPGPARIRFDDGASARHAARLGIPVGVPRRAEDLVEMRAAPALIASADWAGVDFAALLRLRAWMAASPMGLGSGNTEAGPSGVRIAAARLVEEGADPSAVLRAMTSDAATILGDPSRGRVAPGAVADLVLWSGDPTSLNSRPLRVFVAGEEIFHAP